MSESHSLENPFCCLAFLHTPATRLGALCGLKFRYIFLRHPSCLVMRLHHELCALLALVTSPCNAATRRRRRKGAALTAPATGAWNTSSLAEPWREPWYEHWRRGRANDRAAWRRLAQTARDGR